MSTPDKRTLDRGIEAVARALVDFGYPSVTEAQIRSYHTKWLDGGQEDDIVFKFAEKEFIEYPEVFGRADHVSYEDEG